MLKTLMARFIFFRLNERTYNLFMAIHEQRRNPYWMADRRELRDRGAFLWLLLPSERSYEDRANPYRIA